MIVEHIEDELASALYQLGSIAHRHFNHRGEFRDCAYSLCKHQMDLILKTNWGETTVGGYKSRN